MEISFYPILIFFSVQWPEIHLAYFPQRVKYKRLFGSLILLTRFYFQPKPVSLQMALKVLQLTELSAMLQPALGP